jgi:Recombination endonuclease VII
MADLTCKACGSSFDRRVRRGPIPDYCSPKCKNRAGARLRVRRNAVSEQRTCYRCGERKPTSEFAANSHTYCRPCNRGVQTEWRKSNPAKCSEIKRRSVARAAAKDPDYYRKSTLRKFHLSLEQFDLLLQSQGGRCAICPTDDPGGRHGMWHVDHDRTCCPKTASCGRCVRGLLCQNCNLMLGHARDDIARLSAAVAYLQQGHPASLIV